MSDHHGSRPVPWQRAHSSGFLRPKNQTHPWPWHRVHRFSLSQPPNLFCTLFFFVFFGFFLLRRGTTITSAMYAEFYRSGRREFVLSSNIPEVFEILLWITQSHSSKSDSPPPQPEVR